MTIPKYIVFQVDIMRKGTSVELTNITDEVESVILKADRKTEPNSSEFPNNSTISKMEQVEQTERGASDEQGSVRNNRRNA